MNSGSVSPREGSKIDKKDGKDGQKGGRRGNGEKREGGVPTSQWPCAEDQNWLSG